MYTWGPIYNNSTFYLKHYGLSLKTMSKIKLTVVVVVTTETERQQTTVTHKLLLLLLQIVNTNTHILYSVLVINNY